MDRLFELFNEIFPQITLHYHVDARRLSAIKNGQEYGPSGLSDGEKQVFSILADLIDLESDFALIIADEPELNLHPELAERVWTLLENEFLDKTFIYATHSINFALRENVECVYVLSSDSTNIAKFTGLDSLDRSDIAAFLGGLPGILSANRVLVTEGHEKSFDAIFYRWLLDDSKLEIYPGGGCSDVTSIVGKSGLWDKISTKIAIGGVIDGDFNQYKDAGLSSSVKQLELHEAESYLCIPEVLCAVAEKIGSQATALVSSTVVDEIFNALSEGKLHIAAKRVFSISRITLAVSIEKKLLAQALTRDLMAIEISIAAQAEITKASLQISPEQVVAGFDNELQKIENVLVSRDVLQALRLLPGKQLLNVLAPRAGCKNGADLMRSLRRNFKPIHFPVLNDLAASISATLVQPVTT